MANLDVKHIEDYISKIKDKQFQLDSCDFNPVLKLLLEGVCDHDCSLSVFDGFPHIIHKIWQYLVTYWKQFILKGDYLGDYLVSSPDDLPEHLIAVDEYGNDTFKEINLSCNLALLDLAKHYFFGYMEGEDININMMPFVMEKTFEKCRLPEYLRPYWDNVINYDYGLQGSSNTLIPDTEYGKIGFLTISEGYVDANITQRRPGLHTDCPGKLSLIENEDGFCIRDKTGGIEKDQDIEIGVHKKGSGTFSQRMCFLGPHPWGGGYGPSVNGGIFMMSDVGNTCEVINCRIIQDADGNDIIGHLGDVSHLLGIVPDEKETMEANTMYWLTDRTPHMSLPMVKGAYRKFFRLVTSEVSIWFEDHSTKNPLGVVPDPKITKIVKGSKFD